MVVRNLPQYPKEKFVVEGKILKKSKPSDKGKDPSWSNNASEFSVLTEDITSATDANRTNTCDKSHIRKYFIPFIVESRMQTSKDQGIIHLPTASISFLNFLIFSKILVFTSLQEVLIKN